MKKLLMFLAVAMLLFGLNGQAFAYFEDGNLIRAVYQIGGQYEVLTDLGPFTQITPYSGANLSFTSNTFPSAGSGVFSSATWAKLQVAYFIKTPSNAWISGPVDGQKIGSNHFDTYQSSADTVYLGALNYAAGTAAAQIKQTDLQSYVSIMDSGDPSIGAGFFAGFIPAGNGEQNLATLGSGSAYVDSYLYYYATPDSKSSGLQVADIRTFADGHSEIAAVSAAATHTLTVLKTGNGSGTVGGGGTYDSSTSHDITATASAGSTFTGWSGDCTGTASPLTVLVDRDKTCTATFTLNQVAQFTLSVNQTGNGSGTVGGGGTYNSGTSHDITATASAGSTFTGWSGDCTGTASPLTVLVDKAKTCTATFTLNQYLLTVNKTGNGSGTVGGGGTYDSSTSHDITATASVGSTFSGWSGDCTGMSSPLTVLVDKAKTCTATFTLSQYALTVSKTGNGSGTVGGGGTYDYGTSHDITATASSGSTFTGWSGDCTGTTSPLTVLVDKAKTCTATFTLNQVTQFTLTVNQTGNGSGTVGGGGTYNSGTSHDITATASSGSTFTGWSGDCTGTTSPLTVLVDKAKTCTATFTLNQVTQFTLTVNQTGNGSGTVGGGGTYNSGTSHDITATASSGSTFTGWSGDCTGTASPLTVLVDKAKTCTATFTLNQVTQFTLTVNQTGNGSGTVSGGGTYNSGTSHDIAATASSGSTFTGWSGDCTGTTSPLTVLVDKAKTCTATFTLNQVTQFTLTVNQTGNGSGTVGGGGTYNSGTSHDITATASSGSTFTGWSGDCTGTASPLTVLVDKAKTCTATFTLNQATQFTLAVNTSGNGSGTVGGGGTYDSGTSHDITATESAGSTFTGWSGDCTGTASPLTVLVDKAKTCTATFTLNQATQFTLTVNISGNGNGTVGGGGTYNSGTFDDITAAAAAGSTFTGWSGDCTGTDSPLSVLVDKAKTCSATFTLSQYVLTVKKTGTGSGTIGGSGTYDFGTSQHITATALPGSTFSGWTGDCAGTASPLTVQVDKTKTCTAIFTSNQDIAISLAAGWDLFGWVSDIGYYAGTVPDVSDYASGATLTEVAYLGDAMTSIGLTNDDYTAVIGPGGKIYVPGSSFNTLTAFLPGMAYWIYMNADASITLPGVVLPSGSAVQMPGGWIQAAYLGTDGYSPETAFAGISGSYDLIVNGLGEVYIPGSLFNTLSNVNQLEGYFIHATESGELKYSRATHFAVSAPDFATTGIGFNVTVAALDAGNNVVTGYAGTVHFTGTDNSASLPADATLTNGMGTFKATLMTTGNRTINATDKMVPSINGTSNSVTVIQQTGVPIFTLSPASLAFGANKTGAASEAKAVTITNTGTGILYVGNINIAGTDASEFALSGNCTTIPAQGVCTISVVFNASAPFVQKKASLSISSNDPKKPVAVISLSGSAAPPGISVSPSAVNLGTTAVGQTSAVKTVAISNTGVSDLTISTISIAGTNAAEFSQTNNCTSVPAKGACTISITFAPLYTFGLKSAMLNITSDDPKNPVVSVSMTGSGAPPVISVAPTSVNFGTVTVGLTSPIKIVTIKNTGLFDLSISGISITGTNSAEFSQTNNCISVPAGGSCTINLTFGPLVTFGPRSATLNIASDDPKKPAVSVSLSGNGAPPIITVAPTSVNFGTVGVGLISPTKTVTIKNTGLFDLTISVISLSGTNAAEFSQTNNCITVPAGSSCPVSITMSPAAPGSKVAQINILSNDPKNPSLLVSLTGAGQ